MMRLEREWRLIVFFEGLCALRFHLVPAWARSWQHAGIYGIVFFCAPWWGCALAALVAACGVARVALHCTWSCAGFMASCSFARPGENMLLQLWWRCAVWHESRCIALGVAVDARCQSFPFPTPCALAFAQLGNLLAEVPATVSRMSAPSHAIWKAIPITVFAIALFSKLAGGCRSDAICGSRGAGNAHTHGPKACEVLAKHAFDITLVDAVLAGMPRWMHVCVCVCTSRPHLIDSCYWGAPPRS